MQNPRLFDNLYGKTWQEIMDSVPNWQVCGYGFKGWNDPVKTPNGGNVYTFYTHSSILAITDDGKIYICTRDTLSWKKIIG